MSGNRDTFEFDSTNPARHVDDLLHEVLNAEQHALVGEWCESTEEGRAAYADALKRKALLDEVSQSSPPESKQAVVLAQKAVERVESKVNNRRRGWRIYRQLVVGVTAASVLALALAQIYFQRLAPSPYDIRVIGQAELIAGSYGSIRIEVRHVGSGERIEGVPLQLSLLHLATGEQVRLARYESGQTVPRIEIPDWDKGQAQLIVSAELDGAREQVAHSIEIIRPWKLLLSTDKPLYQPGQTVHLRCLGMRRPELRPVSDNAVVFRIRDPKGNVIFKQEEQTSQFGIASADCPLANEIMLGEYVVECQVGSTTSKRTVKVDRYVLPKLKLALTFDRPYYSPGEQLNVDLDASYVFGQPVSGGNAELFVAADGLNVDFDSPLLQELDPSGKTRFKVQLPDRLAGSPVEGGGARIRFVARVTDPAGQQVTQAASRLVTNSPLLVEFVPEAPLLVPGEKNRIYAFARYADGTPAQVDLAINGGLFETATNELGIAQFEVIPDGPNMPLLGVATDSNGVIGRVSTKLSVARTADAFLIRTDHNIYAGGDTVRVEVLGGGNEPVLVDLVKDNQTIASYRIDAEQGRGVLDFDLPPDVFGTIRLEAFRLASNSIPQRQTRIIVVQQANELQIASSADKSEYRPGQTAQLQFRLTDSNGNPRPGAIGVSVVDEAVYSLLSSTMGLERAFFLLEQELLEPVYTIYDDAELLRGRNVESNPQDIANRTMLERAVFARAVQISESAGADFDRRTPVVERVRYSNPYSLIEGSFEPKRQRVETKRRSGLKSCSYSWLALGGTLGLVLIGGFAFAFPRVFALLAAGMFALLLLVGGLALMYTRLGASAENMFAGDDAAAETMALPPDSSGGEVTNMAAERGPREGHQAPPTVRSFFPETLLWEPELISDDQGLVMLEVPLADSITTWRLDISAVDTSGNLGFARDALVAYQPFQVDIDLPVRLTRGDQIELPIVVYNFESTKQDVRIHVQQESWFEWAGGDNVELELELGPGEVRSIPLPLKVTKVGQHALTVQATGIDEQGTQRADAIRRSIEVIPDGIKQEITKSGILNQPIIWNAEVPTTAIEGSVRSKLRVFPTTFSQLVDGIDAIFARPHGCFEQTSSTTYPNVLAMQYMRQHQIDNPVVEAKARQYIHLGYQRLLSFECSPGAFDWYGRAPGSVALTAYGLLEFKDMAKVHAVDPRLIARTERWLLSRRGADGAWPLDAATSAGIIMPAADSDSVKLMLTASVAWSVFEGGANREQAALTRDFLLSHPAETIDDPYLLAMMVNALYAISPLDSEISPYAERLARLAESDETTGEFWWSRDNSFATLLNGRGIGGQVEITSLATIALLQSGNAGNEASGALQWIAAQKDAQGAWHSTQATILALKALLLGSLVPDQLEQDLAIELIVDGMTLKRLEIPVDQHEVVQLISLSEAVQQPGPHQFELKSDSNANALFQFDLSYYVAGQATESPEIEPLQIDVVYDKSDLAVEEIVGVEVTAFNHTPQTAPMVMVELPIPAGFELERSSLEGAVEEGRIGKYQLTPRELILYLRQLEPGKPWKLEYQLRATLPVQLQIPAAEIYEYYAPERRSISDPAELTVTRT